VKRNQGAAGRAEDRRQNQRRHVPDEGQRQRPAQDGVGPAGQAGRALQLEQRIAFHQRETASFRPPGGGSRKDRSFHLEERALAAGQDP
jgi:hypothetical protein